MSMTEATAAAGKNSFPARAPREAPKGTTGRSISKGIRLCDAAGHGNCGGCAWSRPVNPCARRSAMSWPCRCTPSHASNEISMPRIRRPTLCSA
ncbi:Os01g0729950 [Oryza sativa Japonica Group]|uniref:Os01g0729950 protein n=1 Tax=Oryza sativa subsp. japonica TaxID=39947 RepID=A0A0P0V7S3_ORYSJ|nr:Os01g0729950 [Oryza sativa Japonica Group]